MQNSGSVLNVERATSGPMTPALMSTGKYQRQPYIYCFFLFVILFILFALDLMGVKEMCALIALNPFFLIAHIDNEQS